MLSACKETNHNNERILDRGPEFPVSNKEPNLTEYIIVLKENISIANAINSLQKYDVQIIRDLKKGRYLIGLENDPGIDQLEKVIKGSEHIKHIQPNFIYKIQ